MTARTAAGTNSGRSAIVSGVMDPFRHQAEAEPQSEERRGTWGGRTGAGSSNDTDRHQLRLDEVRDVLGAEITRAKSPARDANSFEVTVPIQAGGDGEQQCRDLDDLSVAAAHEGLGVGEPGALIPTEKLCTLLQAPGAAVPIRPRRSSRTSPRKGGGRTVGLPPTIRPPIVSVSRRATSAMSISRHRRSCR